MGKVSPFDFLNSINLTKKDLMKDSDDENQYVGFMVNRGLSYFRETVLYANTMNGLHHADSKLQYSFLLNSIRKGKRFSKWHKADKISDLEVVKAYYGYSNEHARQALTLLNDEQIDNLKDKVSHGGRRK